MKKLGKLEGRPKVAISKLERETGLKPATYALPRLLKAQLITAIIKEVEAQKMTHAELARKSKVPRSAVTGIISGSLQKVTIDRILKLVDAVGLVAHLRLTKAA